MLFKIFVFLGSPGVAFACRDWLAEEGGLVAGRQTIHKFALRSMHWVFLSCWVKLNLPCLIRLVNQPLTVSACSSAYRLGPILDHFFRVVELLILLYSIIHHDVLVESNLMRRQNLPILVIRADPPRCLTFFKVLVWTRSWNSWLLTPDRWRFILK